MPARLLDLTDLDGKEELEDVFIVGTGTSLVGFDWSLLSGRRTIALNDACQSFDPSYLLYTDSLSYKYRELLLPGCVVVCPRGNESSFLLSKRFIGLGVAPFDRTESFDLSIGKRLFVERTVAISAVALAVRLRARRIFLLGVDGYRTKNARYFDGRTRSNSKNYTVVERLGSRMVEKHHLRWCSSMRWLSEQPLVRKRYPGPWTGKGIYNLNPLSRIEAWEKVNLCQVLGERSDFVPGVDFSREPADNARTNVQV